MSRRAALALAPALAAVLLASCSAPGALSGGDRNGYDLRLEFDSALNLPDRARVVLDGVTVGTVTAVAIADRKVVVTARVDAGVPIPADSHATLAQPTVLGDVFVALYRPADAGPDPAALPPGGTVPLARTSSPPSVEDTIAGLANFVASGSIQRAQQTLIGLNTVAESSPVALGEISARVATNLDELADNLDSVDLALTGLADTAAVLGGKRAAIEHWLSPAGMLGLDRATQVTSRLSVMIPSIGSIYSGGFWLVPMLNTLGDAAGAVQGSRGAIGEEIPRWRTLFNDYFLPVDKYPAINITSVRDPSGRELSGDVATVLRMLGATP